MNFRPLAAISWFSDVLIGLGRAHAAVIEWNKVEKKPTKMREMREKYASPKKVMQKIIRCKFIILRAKQAKDPKIKSLKLNI